MNAIRNLFKTKPAVDLKGNHITEGSESKETYFKSGYESSLSANGNASLLKSCLNDVYEKFKDKCRLDEIEQQQLNAPSMAEKERQTTELKKRETLQSIKEDEIQHLDQKVRGIDDEISGVKSDPEKYGIDATKRPKTQFFIGILVIIPITLYLLVFYISASYSAFFKNFDSDKLFESIFDANALTKAMNDGWMEAIFVCTIPFAFMGLGFLIHMFQKQKKWGTLKVIGLFLVTFIFDAILAYQIEKKIYEFGKTLSSAPFDMKIAFSSVEFWGIIFAGFVVYIIWGLVFDFVMKEHDNIDKIKAHIRKLKEDKSNCKTQIEALRAALNDLKQEIASINGKIAELQSKIDGFIFPKSRYLLYHTEYVKGWLLAIASEIALGQDKKDALIVQCEKVAEQHLEQKNVTTDVENIIYKNSMAN